MKSGKDERQLGVISKMVSLALVTRRYKETSFELPINGRLLREQNLSEIDRRTLTKSEHLAIFFERETKLWCCTKRCTNGAQGHPRTP
jgi:hypothetical protein